MSWLLDLAERLQGLAAEAGVSLSARQIEQLDRYLGVLVRWNRRINLTALPLEGFPAATLDRLIKEPLQAVRVFPPAAVRWFDLGSGGGSPAFPLKVAFPGTKLWLVESRARKASFLSEAARTLALDGITVLCDRIERTPDLCGHGSADVVTVRGVRLTKDALAAIGKLLRPGGRLITFPGRRQQAIASTALLPTESGLPGVQVFETAEN